MKEIIKRAKMMVLVFGLIMSAIAIAGIYAVSAYCGEPCSGPQLVGPATVFTVVMLILILGGIGVLVSQLKNSGFVCKHCGRVPYHPLLQQQHPERCGRCEQPFRD